MPDNTHEREAIPEKGWISAYLKMYGKKMENVYSTITLYIPVPNGDANLSRDHLPPPHVIEYGRRTFRRPVCIYGQGGTFLQ